ncbi:hypothetical protein CAN33_0016145 [Aspergillus niger]|uniref:Altered inheritance of mitochondria protein 6 n=1 Tax=Aspergillus niger TaxID=5061 RepID=A0A505IAF1_ASPNG|nr:hypothetical protein CAN33_0016145 [Aspergillus niger]
MVHTRSLAVAASAFLLGDPRLAAGGSTELQSVLKNTHGSNDYGYPTDFTRGIMPIPVHSHNDYWRDIPFYTGLSKGCISTEADVWLYNDTLYVGHDESSLTKDRTLESLYINPILDVLKLQNPSSPFVTSPTNNGVFDTSTSQTLYFFIDLKTSGPETLKAALAEPEYADITGLISPIASTNFASAVGPVKGEKLSDEQIEALRQQIQTAEERGIGARYWGTPYYPVRTRNFVWRTLLEEGVALLNADDLDAVVEYF